MDMLNDISGLDLLLRPESAPLQGTASAAKAIARVTYTHDAMIDLIIDRPEISQNQIAAQFGYTVPWVSRVMNSDAFLARLAARKKDLIDPVLVLSLDEKLRAMASKSLDVVLEKLSNPSVTADFALEAVQVSSKALGYGARQANVAIQNNFVVALPPKAENDHAWAAVYNKQSGTVENVPAQVDTVVATQ